MNVFPVHHFLCALYAEFIHRSFSREIKKNLTRSFNLRFLYLDDSHQYICCMMLSIASMSLTPQIQRNVPHTLIYTLTLKTDFYDTINDFNISIVSLLFIYVCICQHSSNTCIWSLYLSADCIFLNLRLLIWST